MKKGAADAHAKATSQETWDAINASASALKGEAQKGGAQAKMNANKIAWEA